MAQQEPKSMLVSYILLFFFGQLGVHRFYVGKTNAAIIQLVLGLVGWGTSIILIGFLPLSVLWIWLFVDIFLIPGLVREANAPAAPASPAAA